MRERGQREIERDMRERRLDWLIGEGGELWWKLCAMLSVGKYELALSTW